MNALKHYIDAYCAFYAHMRAGNEYLLILRILNKLETTATKTDREQAHVIFAKYDNIHVYYADVVAEIARRGREPVPVVDEDKFAFDKLRIDTCSKVTNLFAAAKTMTDIENALFACERVFYWSL